VAHVTLPAQTQGNFFLEMSSECSCWMGRGMRWDESGLNEFLRDHESRIV